MKCQIEEQSPRAPWAARFSDLEQRRQFLDADLVLLPDPPGHAGEGPSFPAGTTPFFHFLRLSAPAGLAVEIGLSDDEYQELSLHNDVVDLATVLIGIGSGVATSLITNYIQRLIDRGTKPPTIRTTVVFEDRLPDGRARTLRVEVEAPAPEAVREIEAAQRRARGLLSMAESAHSAEAPSSQQDVDQDRGKDP